MKLWAVHFQSESCDHYYESFRCKKKPTDKMLQSWWESSNYGDPWEDEGCQNIYVREIWEIDPKSPELK